MSQGPVCESWFAGSIGRACGELSTGMGSAVGVLISVVGVLVSVTACGMETGLGAVVWVGVSRTPKVILIGPQPDRPNENKRNVMIVANQNLLIESHLPERTIISSLSHPFIYVQLWSLYCVD
jgi:hypothetical protein